ncbi:LysR family substrate-binding domain-containing protein [Agromyces sp. C10]|uniref:LysR family substrate-binding domain-containing protein n=1 Tax=Agromyces sp. C10 TaxID=2935077 RepID=UPI00200A3849|nr:LysR family substrate-binding domain-containing protein [Agromyces sp. C10]MCK8609181.1 LysR family substrate-binding domain-containing protein [Agromyces sp. C10]
MALRLDYVAGVSPAKWLRAWADRRPDLPLEAERVDESAQCDRLRAGEADLAFVRLPVDETGLHRIRLWEELPVAALPKDHPLAEADDLELADLADEPRAPEQDDPAMTLELVAAGTGYAILPHSLARLHHRRDVVAIPVTDAAPTRIALVWRVERDDADIQEFVGVVRGRTARSSRGADEPDETAAPPAKPAAASRDRRQPAGGRRSGGRSGGTGRGGRQQRRGGRRR